MGRAKAVMIQGTMSGAGKSFLCTALCRILRQDGWRTAPFKSQNMALNSAVTTDGLELGRAQAVQAEAAGTEPDVRMNPVLLKPCSDTGSQVVVLGRARGRMGAAEYFRYRRELFPEILSAYENLSAEYDVIVIEGAGSPVELNLRDGDIVNMGLAEAVDAPVLLAGDIDRGGVFAQLYGTVSLLREAERRRVRGLIVNRFRGDVSLFRPGVEQLEALCGVPVLGVVPWIDVELDDEDSLSPALSRRTVRKPLDIAVVRFPRISNFTDFAPLDRHPLLGVRYVDRAGLLGADGVSGGQTGGAPDLLILPGTKSTLSDLAWLRETGIAAEVCTLAAAGVPVLGICGGYQMLGESLSDPAGTEGASGMDRSADGMGGAGCSDGAAGPVSGARSGETVPGLGLLPCRTVFRSEKTLSRVRGTVTAGELSGARVEGYEIHTGVTEMTEQAGNLSHREIGGAASPFCLLDTGTAEGCCQGNVWGTYLHGLFDTGEGTEKLAEYLCRRRGFSLPLSGTDCGKASAYRAEAQRAYRERQYDRLAAGVRAALDMDKLRKIIGIA